MRVTVAFDLDQATLDEAPGAKAQAILAQVGEAVRKGVSGTRNPIGGGVIRDRAGNQIGEWEVDS